MVGPSHPGGLGPPGGGGKRGCGHTGAGAGEASAGVRVWFVCVRASERVGRSERADLCTACLPGERGFQSPLRGLSFHGRGQGPPPFPVAPERRLPEPATDSPDSGGLWSLAGISGQQARPGPSLRVGEPSSSPRVLFIPPDASRADSVRFQCLQQVHLEPLLLWARATSSADPSGSQGLLGRAWCNPWDMKNPSGETGTA